MKSRNNLLNKLAGSTWGANAETLRTSAVALCYSVAEYCSRGRCTPERFYATYLRHPANHTATLAPSFGQRPTTPPTTQGRLRQTT